VFLRKYFVKEILNDFINTVGERKKKKESKSIKVNIGEEWEIFKLSIYLILQSTDI
jgi:hypothetical protein